MHWASFFMMRGRPEASKTLSEGPGSGALFPTYCMVFEILKNGEKKVKSPLKKLLSIHPENMQNRAFR